MARDNTSSALWFIAGVAVGATLGILFAPDSGEHTRKKIARKAEEGWDKIGEQGRELADRGRELLDKGRGIADEAAEMFERGRKLVQS